MANIFQITDLVAKEVLEIAHEKSTFLSTVNRQFDESFDGSIGSTLRIRLPSEIETREDTWVMDVQDVQDSVETLTHGYVIGADLKFTTPEILFALGGPQAFEEISRNKIEPAVARMISKVESRILLDLSKKTPQLVGTPGTVVGASGDISALGSARAKLNQALAPKDGQRYCQLDSVTMGSVATGIKTLFYPADQLKEAFTEGFVGRTAMATFYENDRTYAHTNGDDVAGAVDESAATNFTEGSTTLHMDALGTSVTEGSVFTIADMYDCHPETKQAYKHLKQFTVVGTPTVASNEGDVTFSPAIYSTGAKKNVCTSTGADITWTAAGQNDKVVTFTGSTSTTYQHNLMYHKDFATFVMGNPPLMEDSIKCVIKRKENMAFRVWIGSDIRASELLLRIDGVYGWKMLRPGWACRLTN